MIVPAQLEWKPVPSMAPGAMMAVIEGDLSKDEPFTFRLKLPHGYKIAPHTHPAYERVTVLTGTFHFAHGERYDRARTRALPPGSFAVMPPAIPGLGNQGGFSFWLQDRSGGDLAFLNENLQTFLTAARKRPELIIEFDLPAEYAERHGKGRSDPRIRRRERIRRSSSPLALFASFADESLPHLSACSADCS